MTKHQQLLKHIEQLPLGHKISVRQIAKELEVSEGTAYRAIKEAENRGLVSTVPRVGTVRIEVKQKLDIQQLTFAEIVNIVDGSIQGGRVGLHKSLDKFFIGAMELESMGRYVEGDSLLIVGDREEAQRLALDRGAGVLITGGFDASPAIRAIADEQEIPVISSSYDTFTIATMINRAIHDRMIKKDIIRVEDVMVRDPFSLSVDDTVAGWLTLSRRSGHSRFPVVDTALRVVGIITGRDVIGANPDTPLERVMTKKPQMVELKASISSVAHQMVWLGIEMMPVVEDRQLRGVVTRSDVLKALQLSQRQPHVQMTHADTILSQFSQELKEDKVTLRGSMPPVAMERGSVSYGSLLTVMTEAAAALLRQYRFPDIVAESINIFFLHLVPLEQELEITASLIDIGRQAAKVDIAVLTAGETISRAMASLQNLND